MTMRMKLIKYACSRYRAGQHCPVEGWWEIHTVLKYHFVMRKNITKFLNSIIV
jgi:hypothetical protein